MPLPRPQAQPAEASHRQSKLSFLLSLKEKTLIFFPCATNGRSKSIFDIHPPPPPCVCLLLSRVRLCDPMGCSPSGPLSMGFSKARTLERVAFPSPGDFPTQGSNLGLLALQAGSSSSEPPGKSLSPPGASLEAFLCDEKSLTGV